MAYMPRRHQFPGLALPGVVGLNAALITRGLTFPGVVGLGIAVTWWCRLLLTTFVGLLWIRRRLLGAVLWIPHVRPSLPPNPRELHRRSNCRQA